jgi:hypothetical protein
MTDKRFFHDLSDKERKALTDQFMKPTWCKLESALDLRKGCWGLLRGSIKSKLDCLYCTRLRK